MLKFLLRHNINSFQGIRRCFATATETASASSGGPAPATGDKLVLTLSSPHRFHYRQTPVDQVNLSAASGDMGILAKHIPTIQQLRPGIVEVIVNAQSKKLFASGGFAVMNPDSTLNVSVSEVFSLDNIDPEAVSRGLADAHKTLAGSPSETDKLDAEISLEVYQALTHALATNK